MHHRSLALLVLPAVMLVACEPAPEAVPESESAEAATVPPELQDPVDQALRDLAERLERESAALEVISAESVTWSDGALGCPEPGGMYTQALRPGYRIRIRDGEQVHHYHGARDRDPFYCPPERAGKPLPPGSLE